MNKINSYIWGVVEFLVGFAATLAFTCVIVLILALMYKAFSTL